MKKHNTTKVHGSRFTVLGSRLNAVRSPRSALYALRSSLVTHPSSLIPHPESVRGRSFSSNRGVALVLTLGILALVTLLLMAFVTSMRVENMASKNFNDLIKARQLAQAAVDDAVATIRNATPVITNAPVLRTYVTSPGVISTNTSSGWGMATNFTPVGTTGFVDLNDGNWITGTNADYLPPPAPHTPIPVGWVPVQDNNGQLVGRFAYWVDDESTKVNINVAGTRGNDLEGWTPSAIDLQALFSNQDQTNIWWFAHNIRTFDTLESIKQVTNSTANVLLGYPTTPFFSYIDQNKYYANQFYMTAYSVSPDVTPWGTKRLNLSNVVATASPAAAVSAISNALADATNLGPWFGGQTFYNKYPNLAQIAANIVDYIDNDNIPTDSTTVGPLDTSPPAYLGLEVTPYLSEIDNSNRFTVVSTGTGSNTISWIVYTQVELWNMYTNSWTIPANTDIFLTNIPPVTLVHSNVDTAFVFTNTVSLPPNFTIPVAAGVFNAGTYVTYPSSPRQDPFTFTVETNSVTFITYGSNVVTAILRVQNVGRIDYAEIPMAPKTSDGPVTIDTLGNISPAGGNVRARVSEVNDPRVKPVSTNWYALTSGSGTPGAPNSVFDPTVSIPPFQADGDISCHIISGSRDRGTMYPGEMAFIHTGVPWRTFWLQPLPPAEAGMIPDWAALDLFSATDLTNVVGRVNINSLITSDPSFPLFPSRLAPLFALLTNNLPSPALYLGKPTVPYNIYFSAPALYTNVFLQFPAFPTNAFTFVGEICEIKGLATNDLSLASRNKAVAETPVRGIANLITVRSNTFTIWAVAQSIKEVGPPDGIFNGQDFVTGEVKVQAVVERYENPPGTVRFRTLYYRYIYQ